MYPRYKKRGLLVCAAGLLLIILSAGGFAAGLCDGEALPLAMAGAAACVGGLLYQSMVPRRLRRTRESG